MFRTFPVFSGFQGDFPKGQSSRQSHSSLILRSKSYVKERPNRLNFKVDSAQMIEALNISLFFTITFTFFVNLLDIIYSVYTHFT